MKYVVKSIARMIGLELQRFRPASSHAAQLKAMLKYHEINLVLDVGANTGQFGKELRNHIGYRGRIVSFEPMKSAHETLYRAAAKDEHWEVADRAAIGAEQGLIVMNVAKNSVSSSVLPMLDSHAKAAPESRYQGTESVPLTTLDLAAQRYLCEDSVFLVKIDTQGYESHVLKGAEQTLRRAKGVQLELSLVPLYEGQKLMAELVGYMTDIGFELWGVSPAFTDPVSGRTLQLDAVFFRKE